MKKLVSVISPKGLADWFGKTILFVFLIIAANGLVVWAMTGRGPDAVYDTVVTAFTATPFVVFALWMISYLDQLQRRLADLAATDFLTGLANRRAFLTSAGEMESGVLLLLDVDYFKRVNDAFGHHVGDLCLEAVARRLTELTRKGDIVARYGGEEFAIGLMGADLDSARAIGERLADGIAIRACRRGASDVTEAIVTLSIGAVVIEPNVGLEELLSRADAALYKAKESGRARLSVFGQGPPLVVARAGPTAI
ncbi:GGDEF domain-containing protein [Jiella mangrovi]|uniref:diguanylate cyclase n=1 Tax=Jiella mangrovi TaxID=2821407 RepID=A0ABS4BH77_9HYPH|nr:GGDEF domain-containing protein [Jiella mangrovi]MBP0616113.1 diguanylate cyclase [Jiella mangrovi]